MSQDHSESDRPASVAAAAPPGFPFDGDGILTRARALRLGIADGVLRGAVDSGRIVRLRRGVYADPEVARDVYSVESVRARAAAVSATMDREHVFSHTTAAVLLGLPIIRHRDTSIHVTCGVGVRGRAGPGLRIHGAPPVPDVAVEVSGLRVTGVARTLADLARTASPETAVAAGDHALRMGLVCRARLLAEVPSHRGRPGAMGVARLLGFFDGAAESPGESWSRYLISTFADVPTPDLQREFVDDAGLVVGRSDFSWGRRLIGEFDGRVKYRASTNGGVAVEDVVFREKRREDGLRRLGVHVVRWTWDELTRPEALRRRIREGMRIAGVPVPPQSGRGYPTRAVC